MRCGPLNPPVSPFNTSPCMPAPRAHVVHTGTFWMDTRGAGGSSSVLLTKSCPHGVITCPRGSPYKYTHTHAHIHISICQYIRLDIHVSICKYINVYMSVSVSLCVYVCLCLCLCLSVVALVSAPVRACARLCAPLRAEARVRLSGRVCPCSRLTFSQVTVLEVHKKPFCNRIGN